MVSECAGTLQDKKELYMSGFPFLGILPPHQASHDFVMQQRRQQYSDLHDALVAMRRVTDSNPQSEVFLKMFLVEEGLLPFEEINMVNCSFLCERGLIG